MEKVRIVVIGDGKTADKFCEENVKNDFIEIVGRIPDIMLNDNKSIQYKDLLEKSDIGFALGYSKIIPGEICDKYFIINLHAGVLPKWRGFSANAWAIMNNENEIGYSLHRVTRNLDGGLLFYVKHIPINKEQTMSDVYDDMIWSIIRDCPEKLYDIFNGNVLGKIQTKDNLAYCTRFNAEMGIIRDFSRTADYYVNLYRCMAEPVGSGISFYYKTEKYRVGKIEHGCKYGATDYLCQEGKVVNIQDGELWVKVKDNVIVLSRLKKNGVDINPREHFVNGTIVGD